MAIIYVAEIAAARDLLAGEIAGGDAAIRLSPDDQLDCAGAQLLLSAVLEARAAGRRLTIELPKEGEAARIWRELALDAIPETIWTEEGCA